MKALIRILVILPLVALTACLTDTGSTEVGTPVTEPPDFTVSDGNPPEPPPPDDNDNTTLPTEPEPDFIEEGFLINNGATRTGSTTLDLQLITLNRFQMKISNDDRCSGGTWEPWQEFKTIPTPALNAINTFGVQYRDWDGRITQCYRQTILHDGAGPSILFTRYPAASLEEGATADIEVSITDAAGTVQQATCALNGLAKPCLPGVNSVSITQLPAGSYTFAVTARDDLNNESSKSVSWEVVSTTRRLSQGVRVNDYKKVDILVVIDNSGSMEYEQQSMASRTRNLLSVIDGLDYQIAVTTTDPRNSVSWGDGKFLPIWGSGGQYVIDASTPIETAQERLSKTLQRSETGSGEEQGIRAAYRVIEKYNANDSKARAFLRDGAQFAVLVISDEDESANTTKNDPQSLINLIHSSFGGSKTLGFHSIVTKPGDTACRSTYGYSYGQRYALMSQMTGGILGSVCERDYAPQIQGIANGIRDLLKTMTLQCAPLADRGIVVKRAGTAYAGTYRIEGVNLKFDAELEPGDYSVEYSCLR